MTQEEFFEGVSRYEANETRDAMYKVATFVVSQFWGNPNDMADGLGVLLLTWNQAFYRYGSFNFDRLERCIRDNLNTINGFRVRDISGLVAEDGATIERLFRQFLDALQIAAGPMMGKKSPVAVSKALHLLAPRFLPPWDYSIARAYGCAYAHQPEKKYVRFCQEIKQVAEAVVGHPTCTDKTLIKLIDQYNYAKFSKKWV